MPQVHASTLDIPPHAGTSVLILAGRELTERRSGLTPRLSHNDGEHTSASREGFLILRYTEDIGPYVRAHTWRSRLLYDLSSLQMCRLYLTLSHDGTMPRAKDVVKHL